MTQLWVNRWLRQAVIVALIAAAYLAFRAPLAELIVQLSAHPATIRPAALLLLALVSLFVAVAGYRLAIHLRGWRLIAQPRFTLRLLGHWWVIVPLLLVPLFVWIGSTEPPIGPFAGLTAFRSLDYIVPFLAGLHGAWIFSLEDDPLLELTLTLPRPFAGIILERFCLILLTEIAAGLVGTGVAILLTGADAMSLIVNWLPVTVLFTAIGVRVSLSTRHIVLGVMLTGVLWFGLRMFGDGLLFQWPFTWFTHPFLQPLSPVLFMPGLLPITDYRLNRVFLLMLAAAVFLSALPELRDEEKLTTGRTVIKER